MQATAIHLRSLCGYYRRRAPLVFPGHSHTAREFKYILSGHLEVTYDNSVLCLSPGDVMLTEPDVFHRERTLDGDCEYVILQLLTDDIPVLGHARVMHLSNKDEALAAALCDELARALPDGVYGGELLPVAAPCIAKLLEILLYRLCCAEGAPIPTETPRGRNYRHAIDLMKTRLDGRLTLPEIAKACAVSPTLLKNVFREYTGHGVAQHYLGMRLEAVRRLLSEGQTVREATDTLGFSSQSYLTQCFRRECGCTPSEYRKKHRPS